MLYWGLLLPIESFFSWKKPLILATLTEKSSIQCLRCSLMTTCVTRSKSQRNYFWWSLVCNQGHVLRGFPKFEVLSVFVGCFLLLLYFYCCSRSSKTTVFNRSWTIWIYHQTAPISSKWSMQMAPCTHMFFVGMKRQALLLMAWLLHDTKEGTLPGHSLWTAVKTPFESFEFIWMLFQHLCTKPMPVTILIEDAKSVWISLVESRTVHRPQVAELCKSLSSCRLIDYMVQWCRTRSN